MARFLFLLPFVPEGHYKRGKRESEEEEEEKERRRRGQETNRRHQNLFGGFSSWRAREVFSALILSSLPALSLFFSREKLLCLFLFFPRPFMMHLKDTWYFRLLISVTSNDVGKNSPEARSKLFAGSNRGLLLPSSEIRDLPCFWKLPPVTRRRTCSEEEGLFWRRRPFPFSQPKKGKLNCLGRCRQRHWAERLYDRLLRHVGARKAKDRKKNEERF